MSFAVNCVENVCVDILTAHFRSFVLRDIVTTHENSRDFLLRRR